MKLRFLFVSVICIAMLSCPVVSYGQKGPVAQDRFSVAHYDPKRNANNDLKAAVAEAGRSGKRILLQVGGEWCSWCHTMDKFYRDHAELLAAREQNYILLKINFSPDNRNQAFLSHYPEITGYPHIFILDQSGALLRSEDTSELELGESYDLNRFMAFLKRYAPYR